MYNNQKHFIKFENYEQTSSSKLHKLKNIIDHTLKLQSENSINITKKIETAFEKIETLLLSEEDLKNNNEIIIFNTVTSEVDKITKELDIIEKNDRLSDSNFKELLNNYKNNIYNNIKKFKEERKYNNNKIYDILDHSLNIIDKNLSN